MMAILGVQATFSLLSKQILEDRTSNALASLSFFLMKALSRSLCYVPLLLSVWETFVLSVNYVKYVNVSEVGFKFSLSSQDG